MKSEEVRTVATKSFLKNVSLRDEKQCKAFIRALENSENQPNTAEHVKRSVHTMSSAQIQKIFGSSESK